VLGAALIVCGAAAQESEFPPETTERARRYTPPPAWKSVEIANYYLRTKKYKAALSRYEEAIKTDPYYAPAYRGLGKVYEKLGLKQKALDAYHRYLDMLPSAKDAEEAKDVHQAIARLKQALSTNRRSSGQQTPPAPPTAE